MFRKTLGRLIALGALFCAPLAVTAQSYPDKPVTLVIPYAAGGSTETMARVFSLALAKKLGQPVVVKVMPGAGGALGATEVAKADPDGYTLLFAATSSLLWPPLTLDVEYDLDSFAYVAKITDYQQAIVAKADAPYNTLEELIAHTAGGNRLSYGDQSALSRAYIDYIAKEEGVAWTGIPTKGGGEMVPFLLGGKIDFAWSGGVHQRYGDEMKVLLSMNAERLGASPDVPSIAEKYGISMPSQAVIVAPAGTPEDIVGAIATAAEAAMGDGEFQSLMNDKLQFPLSFKGPQAISDEIGSTVDGLKKVAGSL